MKNFSIFFYYNNINRFFIIVCIYSSWIIMIKDQEQIDEEYAASMIDSQWKTLYTNKI